MAWPPAPVYYPGYPGHPYTPAQPSAYTFGQPSFPGYNSWNAGYGLGTQEVGASWGCGAPSRHPRYYYEDGNLAIQIGSTQYNLHRYLFKSAQDFPWHEESYYGANGAPFALHESQTDFDRLLSVLYPADYTSHECKTAEEWTSVLVLADKWGMQNIRTLAIAQLSLCAGAIDKIALGHRYGVAEWLKPGYMELAMRKEALTAEEGAKLGVEALVRIAALKDEVLGNLSAYVDEDKFSALLQRKLWM
ncbi:hypothetical protein FB45DRAFT_731238 [Roridomyces roridus]|uniref:BTB domain-containing protein n=1 Tax=Roridomyces roridus TaxID=1738132 RepID=A0AAD7CKE2_9AGAR|nr:hypothetical protein FB45DRAFT_731238 [Roridomyces roridus]